MPRTALLILTLLTFTAAACGSSGPTNDVKPAATVTVTSGPSAGTTDGDATGSPSASPSSSPTSAGSQQLSVYFVRSSRVGVVHRWVPKTQMVATAALSELLSGLVAGEIGSGVYSTIPEGTTLRKVTIAGTVATVDLSSAFSGGSTGPHNRGLRVAQVVFTTTQFSTVKSVLLKVNGAVPSGFESTGLDLSAPLRRADLEAYTPAILVESPAINDTVGSPMKISGTANVFEGSFIARIARDDGTVIAKKTVQASSGSGTRGTFTASIPFTTGEKKGWLVVFAPSAKDGSPTNVVKIPLAFK